MADLSAIPKVDTLAKHAALADIPPLIKTSLIRAQLNAIRSSMIEGSEECPDAQTIVGSVLERFEEFKSGSLKTLINATGVVVHTNLGRSVLDEALFDEVKPFLVEYTNLEYDLARGSRGERYTHLSAIMREALGCEDALVVNNNAAAVFLILNTFANGKEAVISRGELVEIGGSFRIPEVMRSAGATLREVGTTNKTKRADYEAAIGENCAMLMKVHRSNFVISGFTEEVDFAQISALAKQSGVIDYFDLGSGQFSPLGASNEPLLSEIAKLSPSLVSFSGDKLFG
ncbi:MAG: L-seryl-tRNA(Sec) selenium transferase, partial [Helicobacteraceae bacterium]|nr:L-seryl-tRNA(Sec) selenium transferase [Helicobacteraceae bacterium]